MEERKDVSFAQLAVGVPEILDLLRKTSVSVEELRNQLDKLSLTKDDLAVILTILYGSKQDKLYDEALQYSQGVHADWLPTRESLEKDLMHLYSFIHSTLMFLSRAGKSDAIQEIIRIDLQILVTDELIYELAVHRQDRVLTELVERKCKYMSDFEAPTDELGLLTYSIVIAKGIQFVVGYEEEWLGEILQQSAPKNNNHIIIKGLLMARNIELIKKLHLINYCYSQLVSDALHASCFEYVLANYQSFTDNLYRGVGYELVNDLIDSLSSLEEIEAKLFLLKNCIPYITNKETFQILNALKNGFDNGQILDYSYNPIKLAVLCIELISLIKGRFKYHRKFCKSLREKFNTAAVQLQNCVENDYNAKLVYMDLDIEGRELLVIMSKLKLYDLMCNPFVRDLVQVLWGSKFDLKGSLAESSLAHFWLFKWPFRHTTDLESEQRLKPHETLENSTAQNSLNYFIWQRSVKVRFFAEFFSFFFLTCFFQVWMILLLNSINAYKKDIKGESFEEVYYFISMNVWFTLVFCLIPFIFFFQILFIYKTKRPISMFTIDNLLLFILFGSTVLLVFRFLFYHIKCELDHSLHKCIVDEYIGSGTVAKLNLGLIMLVLWFKVILFFKVSTFAGQIIKIFIMICYYGIQFFVLYTIQLIGFTCVFSLLFANSPAYNPINNALFTLFRASLLSYKYEVFDEPNIKPAISYMGYSLLTLYLIINGYILLNMLYAVFATAYRKVYARAKSLYLAEIVYLYQYYKFDAVCSSYTSAPFPWIAFLVLLLPLILLGKDQVKINSFLMKLIFSVMLLIYIVGFIIYHLLLLPFVYLKIVVHKFTLMLFGRSSGCWHFMQFILYLVFGIFLLLGQMGVDLVALIKHIFSGKLKDLSQHKKSIVGIMENNVRGTVRIAKYMFTFIRPSSAVHNSSAMISHFSQVQNPGAPEEINEISRVYGERTSMEALQCKIKTVDSSCEYLKMLNQSTNVKKDRWISKASVIVRLPFKL